MIIQTKPAYQKIYETIKEKIVEGTYLVGDILPSEAELEKMFNVSRTPVRNALKQILKMISLFIECKGKVLL